MKSFKVSQLPQFLNMYQAKAWVLYRDYSIIERSKDWWAFEDYSREKVGTEEQLGQALLSGALIAYGKRNGSETFESISPIDWEDMEIAPTKEPWPFKLRRVKSVELEKIFPPTGGMNLLEADPGNIRRKGRTPGTGINDDKYISDMESSIRSGTYSNATAAAKAVVKQNTEAFKNPDAAIDRLRKKYKSRQVKNGRAGTFQK